MTVDAAPGSAEADLGQDGEAEWARLRRQLELAEGFWLGFIFSSSPGAVSTLRRRTEHALALRAAKFVELLPTHPDALRDGVAGILDPSTVHAGCVWVQALVEDDGPWYQAWNDVFLRLNERRDAFRRHLRGGLLLAAPLGAKSRAREAAPDLWSIRSLVIELREPARTAHDFTDLRRDDDAPGETATRAVLPLSGPHRREARSLLEDLAAALALGRTEDAVEAGHAAVKLARATGDKGALVAALTALSRAVEAYGDDAAAIDHAREALRQWCDGEDALKAELLDRIGRLALNRSDLDTAQGAFEDLVAIRRKTSANDRTLQALGDLAIALGWLGRVRSRAGDLTGATEACEEGLTLHREVMQAEGDNPEAMTGLVRALRQVCLVRRDRGDAAGAAKACEESLQLARRLREQYGDTLERLDELAASLERAGFLRWEAGDATAAAEAYEESLALQRELIGRSGESPERLRNLSNVLGFIGVLRHSTNDELGAVEVFEESLRVARRLVERYGENPERLRRLAVSLAYMGDVRRNADDFAAAADMYDESLASTRRLVERYGESPEALRDLSLSLRRVGDLRRGMGDAGGAAEAYEEALQLARRVVNRYGTTPKRSEDIGRALGRLAAIRRLQADELDAERARLGQEVEGTSPRLA